MGNSLKVLILTDNPSDADLLERELQRVGVELSFSQAATESDFMEALNSFLPDLILSDLTLKSFDSLSALRTVREKDPFLPFIFFADPVLEKSVLESMQHGATNYIFKDRLSRLTPAVTLAIEEGRERKEKLQAEEKLRRSYKIQGILNDLLKVALQPILLTEQLTQMTRIILSAPVIPLGARGGIFLLEYNMKKLPLPPYSGLMDELRAQCSALPWGHCFCGQLVSPEKVFVAEDPEGIAKLLTQGTEQEVYHFLPIASGGEVLGVIYLAHPKMEGEERSGNEFLSTAANIVATTIERKKKEEEIKALSSQLSAVIEHIPQGVFLLDEENRLVHGNSLGLEYIEKTACVKLGQPLTHILGRPAHELLIEPPPFIWHELDTKEPPVKTFAVAGRRIDEGKGTVFVMRDVTEEKQNLEKIHSQERLAAVGQMAAGIAHDFNNFLSTIIGYADFLLMTERMNEEMKGMVETIGQSGRSASTLIKQILDFSRKSETEMILLDLKPFVKEFTKLIRELIPENIRISYTLGDGHYLIEGDLTKIKQLLVNLSINSRDAMPQGGILNIGLTRMTVADTPPLPAMEKGKEWIALSVGDTGVGIPPEIVSHIFEPFYTTKEAGTGTGLGLSQVYGIVKQHNGFIDVHSETGKGTTFTIYLPPAESEEDLLSQEEGGFTRGSGQTVLVVEDDDAMRDFVGSALSSLGYHVMTAHNGKEGLRVFNRECDKIDIVVTDVLLPELGGIDLCRNIRRQKPGLPVVGMTGYDREHFAGEIDEAGFNELLLKPFTAKKLSTVIAATLS